MIEHTLIALTTALKLALPADAAAGRAADNALADLLATPALAFDGTELRVLSSSRKDGTYHVADATGCSCDGARHPWCRHRAGFRLMLAELALRDPAELIRQIVSQHALEAADASEVAPAPRIAAVIAGLTDDAAYAESLLALDDNYFRDLVDAA